MNRLFLLFGVFFVGLLGSVSAYSMLECARDSALMSEALGTDSSEWDFNGDGVVNLIDVGLLAKKCYAEDNTNETEEDVVIPEPVIKRGGDGITARPMMDGSVSYFFKAHAYQLSNGVLLQWSKGFVGSVLYDGFEIMIQDGVGVNVKEVKL